MYSAIKHNSASTHDEDTSDEWFSQTPKADESWEDENPFEKRFVLKFTVFMVLFGMAMFSFIFVCIK
jgi:hypothetical protein